MTDAIFHYTQLAILALGICCLLSLYAGAGSARPAALIWFCGSLAVLLGMRLLQLFAGVSPEHLLLRYASTVNNAFLLMAASHLDYGVDFLKRARQSSRWKVSVFVLTLLVATVTWGLSYALPSSLLALLPDVLLSLATLALLGFGLANTLRVRGYAAMGLLAWLVVAALIGVQLSLSGFLPMPLSLPWMRAVSQLAMIGFILVFVVLAVTWAQRLAEEAEKRPAESVLRLVFTNRPSPTSASRTLILYGDRQLEASRQPYADLLKLARLCLRGDGWGHMNDIFNADYKRLERMRGVFAAAGLDAPITNRHPGHYRLTVPARLIDVSAHEPSPSQDRALAQATAATPSY